MKLFLLLLLALPSWGQTQVPVEQLISRKATPSGYALVVLPTGQISVAVFDGMTVDTSAVATGGLPILRIAAVAVLRDRSIVFTPQAITPTFAFMEAATSNDSVVVVRNGLELSEGIDYTVAPDLKSISFTPKAIPLLSVGDIIKVRYRY